MKAILLAAGMGKRLEPITNLIPKPMIKVAGKPILEYILEDLLDCGFDDFCIVVGHESKQIIEYFENWNKNAKITFVMQEKLTGTATAVYCAKDFVGKDPFLLYLSDTLIPIDLKSILSEVLMEENAVSILSSKVFFNDSTSVGNIVIEDNYVTQISEKSANLKSNLAWAGLAFFKDASIFQNIENLSPSERGEYDITEVMNLFLNQNKKIKNYLCEKFIDCGTPNGLLEGVKFILECKYHKKNNYSIKIIEPCYIGKNCSFGDDVTLGPFVSIGDNVTISNHVKLEKSLIFDYTNIQSNKVITSSIISNKFHLSLDNNVL